MYKRQCWDSTELEDIYLPYKPKRRTRAQVARELGLAPLADIIMQQRERNVMQAAQRFVKEGVDSVSAAIDGAKDIIAENICENEQARQRLRNAFLHGAVITSKVVKTQKDTDEAAKYRDYFDFSEPLRRCSGNRLLAMRRGENEGILRINISVDNERAVSQLQRQFVRGYGDCALLVKEAAEDAYKRPVSYTHLTLPTNSRV